MKLLFFLLIALPLFGKDQEAAIQIPLALALFFLLLALVLPDTRKRRP